MTIDEVRQRLTQSGNKITDDKRLPNGTGSQISLECGAKVNVFDKGTVNVQGRNSESIKNILGLNQTISQPSNGKRLSRVFVVYGHDVTARTQLEAMLRRWGLEPLILEQLPSEGQTLIEKLESYISEVEFAVILATPDDEGFRREHADEKAFRARQNVVLELGMMLALLGRKKVAILLKSQEAMEKPSDIQGLIYIPFKDDLQKEAGLTLAKEMRAQGYEIDVSNI